MQPLAKLNAESGWDSSKTDQLQQANEFLANQIKQELKTPLPAFESNSPKDYFDDSYFWQFSSEDAKSNWHYCFSMFRSKEEVLPNVFIGAQDYALIGELLKGDYTHKSNDYYAQNDLGMFLSFRDQEAENIWKKIKSEKLGSLQTEIPFTRVISITTNAREEKELKKELLHSDSTGYQQVNQHKFVQLRDLPNSEEKVQDQLRQWNLLKEEFKEIFSMIDTAREERKPILIHCKRGRHRSVAILAAYLMSRMRLTAEEALSYICMKRGCAVPYGPPKKGSEFSALLDELTT